MCNKDVQTTPYSHQKFSELGGYYWKRQLDVLCGHVRINNVALNIKIQYALFMTIEPTLVITHQNISKCNLTRDNPVNIFTLTADYS